MQGWEARAACPDPILLLYHHSLVILAICHQNSSIITQSSFSSHAVYGGARYVLHIYPFVLIVLDKGASRVRGETPLEGGPKYRAPSLMVNMNNGGRTQVEHAIPDKIRQSRTKKRERGGGSPETCAVKRKRETSKYMSSYISTYYLYYPSPNKLPCSSAHAPSQSACVALGARWRRWEDKRAVADRAPPVLDAVVSAYETRDARCMFVAAARLFRHGPNERYRRLR